MFLLHVNQLRSEQRALFHQFEENMKNSKDKIVINKIEWSNNESEMHISCNVQNGFFAYNTTLVLPGSDLNKVITQLQKQNNTIDIQDCLIVEQWAENEFLYVFNFGLFTNTEFQFENQILKDSPKQIRA